jgi:hypothetical protein
MPYDMERQRQIDRTRTGVLLLFIGALIGAIPYVGGIGALFTFIGAIFVILGRKAFGATHARNVILSIVLFILGISIAFVGALVVFLSIFAAFGQDPSPAAVQAAFSNFLIVIALATIVGGLASVFFTFAIQNQTGRLLLIAGYIAGVVISIAIVAVISASISEFVATACPGGVCDPLSVADQQIAFQNRVSTLGFLNAIPSLLYAGAYYLVWDRVKKGEIPGPSMPGMAPPTMPMPPR